MTKFLELCKIKISLFSAFSAITGYILATPCLWIEITIISAGVFLLACGSGALNQYQERDIDGLMHRTKGRPIPSNRIRPKRALYLSLVLIFSGLLLIWRTNPLLAGLGLFALFLYNGVYTYLKKTTAFILIPGALTGAIPPLMGWIAGGGGPSDPQIVALCFFFFSWQVPHFWLLILNHGDEYEKAGLESLSRIFTKRQLLRITLIWMFTVAVASIIVPLFGDCSPIVYASLLTASSWFCWKGIRLLKEKGGKAICRQTFKTINAYVFIVMLFLTIEGTWRLGLWPLTYWV